MKKEYVYEVPVMEVIFFPVMSDVITHSVQVKEEEPEDGWW